MTGMEEIKIIEEGIPVIEEGIPIIRITLVENDRVRMVRVTGIMQETLVNRVTPVTNEGMEIFPIILRGVILVCREGTLSAVARPS